MMTMFESSSALPESSSRRTTVGVTTTSKSRSINCTMMIDEHHPQHYDSFESNASALAVTLPIDGGSLGARSSNNKTQRRSVSNFFVGLALSILITAQFYGNHQSVSRSLQDIHDTIPLFSSLLVTEEEHNSHLNSSSIVSNHDSNSVWYTNSTASNFLSMTAAVKEVMTRTETEQHRHQRKQLIPVYIMNAVYFGSGANQSSRLELTDDPHLPHAIWVVGNGGMKQLPKLINETMAVRKQRNLKLSEENYSERLRSSDSSATDNVKDHPAQRNIGNDHWKIFIVDFSDKGGGDWFNWFLRNQIVPLLDDGNTTERVHYITRTTQIGRAVVPNDKASKEFMKEPAKNFYYKGKKIDFNKHLGVSYSTVQKFDFPTREELIPKLENYLKDIYKNQASGFDLSRLERPTDIRTFWNRTICNKSCRFRNMISENVLPRDNATVPIDAKSNAKQRQIVANTDIVGHFHRA